MLCKHGFKRDGHVLCLLRMPWCFYSAGVLPLELSHSYKQDIYCNFFCHVLGDDKVKLVLSPIS